MLDEARVREIHDSGFRLVAGHVPGSPSAVNSVFERLVDVIRFRRETVGWAYLDGDTITALEEGSWTAWMIVVPEHHRLMAEQKTIFRARADWGANVVLIRPVAMSSEWAGLGQVHESSHLYDIAAGIEPAQPDQAQWRAGEVRAYLVEIALADLMTRGGYSKGLQEAARSFGIGNPQGLLRMVASGSRDLVPVGDQLDRLVSTTPPESEEEEGLRFGLHIVGLGFSLIEGNESPGMSRERFVGALGGMGSSRFPEPPVPSG